MITLLFLAAIYRYHRFAFAGPSICGGLAMLLVATQALAGLPQPIVTQDDVFYVPFTVPSLSSDSMPRRVELFVSGDRGATWTKYQERDPSEGRFSFRAGVDGEFWFATRTIQQNGQPNIARVGEPELIVIVDRSNAVAAGASPGVQPSFTGLPLPASIDEAKPAVTAMPDVVHLSPGQAAPSPPMAQHHGHGPAPWQGSPAATGSNEGLVPQQVAHPPAPQSASLDGWQNNPYVSHEGDNPIWHRPPTPGNASREQTRTDDWSSLTNQPMSPQNSSQAANPRTTNRPDAARFDPTPRTVENGQPNPPVANAPLRSGQNDSPNDTFASRGVLMSQSRKFNLDYDIESADRDSVYRIEVWFTQDGGRTWRHHGDDEDRASPYLVQVSSDGMYGFRLIIQAKEGFAARPPRSGDPADIWIGVDATAPSVHLTSAEYGRGEQTGLLQIQWEARDSDLNDRPITLLYSGHREGPWRKIADRLPNTGRFDWQVDDRAPDQIYLRLEATDRAGNVGIDSLLEPIRGDGLAPRGHIRSVRPAAHADRFGSHFFRH